MTLAKSERAMFRREVSVMRLARHDGILRLLGLFEDRTHVHLVMPLMACDLATYLQRRHETTPCDETDAKTALPRLLDAVSYLHHLGIAHRDLKPDNILLEDASDLSRLKLADFSISQILKPGETIAKAAGSLEYCAPEVFLRCAGFPADVWALGVITILILFLRQPFGGPTRKMTIANIVDRCILPLPWDNYTSLVKDLVSSMLTTDPKKRITADDALHHPWITIDDTLTVVA